MRKCLIISSGFWWVKWHYNSHRQYCSLCGEEIGGGEVVADEPGYTSVAYITDHLGSVRVVVGADGTVIKHNEFLPYGELFNNNDPYLTNNDYLYGGKELQKEFGINLYDSQARFQANTGMFLSLDPLAEKFYGISPYSYCAGNPVNLVDQGGDTIHVAAEDQGLVLKILEKVFDKFASGFKFNKEGNLEYTGTTKGMSKEQKKTFNGLKGVMDDDVVTNIKFDSSLDPKKAAITSLAVENENQKDNNIIINPNVSSVKVFEITDAYYITPIDAKNGARFKETSIQTNDCDLFFHELGHVIYAGQTQDKVIKYNNYVRKILNLPKRRMDETHNPNVKKSLYD